MARTSKFCPTCQAKRPVSIALVPGSTTVPSPDVQYRVTCRACGFTHPPDGPTMQKAADIQTWVAGHRKTAKAAKVARRPVVVPLGPRPL